MSGVIGTKAIEILCSYYYYAQASQPFSSGTADHGYWRPNPCTCTLGEGESCTTNHGSTWVSLPCTATEKTAYSKAGFFASAEGSRGDAVEPTCTPYGTSHNGSHSITGTPSDPTSGQFSWPTS